MSPVHDPEHAAAPGSPTPTAGFAAPGSASAPAGRRSPYGARDGARRTSVLGAHQPGPVPLRPLRAGDLLDGALAILRGNPAPLIVPSLALGLLALLGPLAVGAVVDLVPGTGGGALGDGPADGLRQLWSSGLVLALRVGVSVLGAVLLTGVVAQVVLAAAVGERIDLGEAWRRTRGRRGALLLLAVLATAAVTLPVVGWLLLLGAAAGVGPGAVVAVLVIGLPALAVALAWPGVRLLYLCVPAHAVERIGARRAWARSWALSRGRYWHVVGVALMALGVCLVGSILLALPLTVVGSLAPAIAGVPGEVVGLGLDAVAQVLAQALAVPFAAVVCSLQYLDLRIRAEAYDVELLARADAASTALTGRDRVTR